MPSDRTRELYKALQEKGYPDEFCREIAYKYMTTDYTATRMLGYLYRVTSRECVENTMLNFIPGACFL